MIYVLDSSFVAAQIIPDEFDLQVKKMYSKINNDDEKCTPQLFWYEMTNLFKNLLRRKRYSIEEVMEFHRPLAAIRLVSESGSGVEYSQKLLRLCNEYDISSYDASYLELAKRKNAVLCTLDTNLIAAAKKHGTAVLN